MLEVTVLQTGCLLALAILSLVSVSSKAAKISQNGLVLQSLSSFDICLMYILVYRFPLGTGAAMMGETG